MTAGVQDAADVLREVQKLTKELAPVKNALAALYKREEASENAAAAAASLDKIAARMDKVVSTYKPVVEAAEDLTMTDLPSFLQQASLVLMDDETIDEEVKRARHRQERERGGISNAANGRQADDDASDDGIGGGGRRPHRRSHRGPNAHGTPPLNGDTRAGTADVTVFDDVCPPEHPFILQPEDYRRVRQNLQLRVDMVSYLLATGRKAFALHVAESYHLPLLWFPELHEDRVVELQAMRRATRARALTDTIQLTAATPPFANSRGGSVSTPAKAPMSPMLLAAGRPSMEESGSPLLSTPLRVSGTAPDEESAVNASSFVFTAPARPLLLRTLRGRQPSATKRVDAVKCGLGSPNAQSPTTNFAGRLEEAGRGGACNLPLRVLASAAYLKDEYIDRMVLERLVAEPYLVATAIAAQSQAKAAEQTTPATAAGAPAPVRAENNTTTATTAAAATAHPHCRRCLHSVEVGASVSSTTTQSSSSSPAFPRSPLSSVASGLYPQGVSSLMPTPLQTQAPATAPSAATAPAPITLPPVPAIAGGRPLAPPTPTTAAAAGDPLVPTRARADASRELTARVHTWPSVRVELTSDDAAEEAQTALTAAHRRSPLPGSGTSGRPASGMNWRAWGFGAVAPWSSEAMAAASAAAASGPRGRAPWPLAERRPDASMPEMLMREWETNMAAMDEQRRAQFLLFGGSVSSGSATRPPALAAAAAKDVPSHLAGGARWRHVLRSRASAVPVAAVNTQSGSSAFDTCMMGIVEGVLEAGLPNAQHPGLRLPQILSSTSGSVLRPEALLIADDAFAQDKLAIKRATRLFVAHSGTVVGGDPDDDAIAGGVNLVVRDASHSPATTTATSARASPVTSAYVLATPNGSVWTGDGVVARSVLRQAGPADALEDADEEARSGTRPARASLRLQSLLGVPSADEKVVYGAGTLRRIFIS